MSKFRRRVIISFVLVKLLSTEAVETGNVKPIEAVIGKGNIVISISFVMISLSCNAMMSSGFLAMRSYPFCACNSGDMVVVFTVSSSLWVRASNFSLSTAMHSSLSLTNISFPYLFQT